MTIAAGTRLGRYEIRSKIGAGGMGEVYLAIDTELDRKVAIKILPEALASDQQRLQRFIQEAKTASALNHPNILTIHEIGSTGASRFIATEFIDGHTLRQRTTKGTNLVEILGIAIQTAGALAAAHAAGIIHRDIKPENIMVRRDGIAKVLDFGLAKLTEPESTTLDSQAPTRFKSDSGTVVGTAIYMSPEQARGMTVDARTDIFSLGVVLYEMVAGCLPFEGSTSSEVLASILSEKEPQPLARYSRDVPAELERIIAKTLRKNRDERYQTIKDLLLDLKSLKQDLEFERKLERSIPPRIKSAVDTGAQADAETAVESVARPTGGDRGPARLLLNQRNIVIAVAALLVIALGVGAYFYFTRERGDAIASIAVLPFVNASNNPDAEYLSGGISGSLINSLSQLPQLKVIAQSSTFKYKGKEIDPQEVANTLGVQAIVTGRIVQFGDSLQISVELVNARDKTQMWGEQYNRKAADLQAVPGEIARTISEKLRVRLTGAQEEQLTKRPSENPEAYRLFLNGELYNLKGRSEGKRKAFDYYNQAIALDPNFALAYVRLAQVYVYLGSSGTVDPKETKVKAKAAVEKALELDETLAEAHAMNGVIKGDEWDWAGSESEIKRALELNPNLALAHLAYSGHLSLMGRHTEALAQNKLAQELDPLNMSARIGEAAALSNLHRFDEAIRQLQHVIEIQPDFSFAHLVLADSYAMKGMYPEAIAEYQKFSSIDGETADLQIFLGYTYAMSGQREKAVAILNKLKTTKEYVSPAELATLYAGLGDKEGAFQSLERAYVAHDLQMAYLKVAPGYDSLRSDPRFTDLMRRVGLPQ
jgi:serine/threonine protein kinase